MNLKMLAFSFGLVFLAELGDKTQLTALAFSSTSRAPYSVFIGTSLALVLSTALAVLLGELLARHIPVTLIHICSGVMFVLVGLTMLVNVARKAPAAPPGSAAPEAAALPVRGVISGMIMQQAVRFEEDVVAGLGAQAAALPEGAGRDLARRLAAAHTTHVESLRRMAAGAGGEPVEAVMPEQQTVAALASGALAELRQGHEGAKRSADALTQTMQMQEAAAQFYLALARMAHLPEAQSTLRWLAMEELRHSQELSELPAGAGATADTVEQVARTRGTGAGGEADGPESACG